MATPPEPGVSSVTLPTDREVVISRVFDAPRRLVFEAHTDPEHVPQWMTGPDGWAMPTCEIDLRQGGSYRFVLRGPDGSDMELRGVYREVTPPERLVADEAWVGDMPETRNTLTFVERDGRTTSTLTVAYPSKEARDSALETGMHRGASESFGRLSEYLDHLEGDVR